MAGPTPEQLQAANAILQQTLQQLESANQQQQQSFPVTIQNSSLGANPTTLTRALVLEGTAVAVGLDQLIMRTAQGEVLLKIQQMQEQDLLNLLPSRVTLQLRPGPDGLQAILVVGNKPVIPDKPPDSLSAATSLATNQTLAAQIPKINQINQALVLPSSLFSSQTPEEFLQSLTAQAQGTLIASPASTQNQSQGQNIISTMLQKFGFVPQVTTLQATSVQTRVAIPPVLAGSTTIATLPSFEPLQTTSIKILSVVIPDATSQKTAATAIALTAADDDENIQVATVRGNTPSGQPILSVGDKLIAVQGARNWPVGMQLKVAMGPSAAFAIDEGGESPQIKAWGGLHQALETLALQSPALYADIARLRLPQPAASQMPGALLFLFSALQKGMPAWLGDQFTQKLKDLGKDALVRQITDQWRAQMNQPAEGPGGQWRGISIPIFDQEKMQALRFYIYDPPDQRRQGKRDPAAARRFLVDFELSRLGAIQLDGLVHRKRLDLVVRTAHALDSSLRQDLVNRFHHTLEEVRYGGELRFIANKSGWVEIREKQSAPILKKV